MNACKKVSRKTMEHRDSSLLYRPSSVILGRLFMDITYESVQLIRFLILAASTLFQIFVSFACLYPALGLCLGNACISAVIYSSLGSSTCFWLCLVGFHCCVAHL